MTARDRVRDAAKVAKKQCSRLSASARSSFFAGTWAVLVRMHPEVSEYRDLFLKEAGVTK